MNENNKKLKFKISRKNVLFISSIENQVSQVLKKLQYQNGDCFAFLVRS